MRGNNRAYRHYREVNLGPFQWTFWDWSLSYRRAEGWNPTLPDLTGDDRVDAVTVHQQLFALRCATCGGWTLGCREHWFCGMCPSCKAHLERDCNANNCERCNPS
jgi:hypothetical protein